VSSPELGDSATAQRQVLLLAIGAIAFSYYGKAERNAKPAWHDSWTNRMVLPSLIRIAVETRGRMQWPVLTAAPKIAAGVNCRFDPLTDFCQGLE